MIDVTVKVGEKEFQYKFSRMWQVEWFVRILNWFVILLHKWYGVPMNLEVDK